MKIGCLKFEILHMIILLFCQLLGRGSSLSEDERNEVKATVNRDKLLLKKRKKEKRAHNKDTSNDDLGSLFGDGIMGKLPRLANKITLKVCFSICCSQLL